ncbi:hypothetical protein SynPROSU1_00977 [Synechococcus sp. PROS-U-1]|nr:hypothetical protein SynPROSU1_00977 [Synechococcus sp. PROS-U-1]
MGLGNTRPYLNPKVDQNQSATSRTAALQSCNITAIDHKQRD